MLYTSCVHAIATLNDVDLDGRSLFVRQDREAGGGVAESRPRAPAPRAAYASTAPAADAAPTHGGCQVYVGNLPWNLSWQELRDHLSVAGSITHADVPTDASGRSRGFGTVLFASTREAAKAIQLFNESELNGRTIEVRPDQFCT